MERISMLGPLDVLIQLLGVERIDRELEEHYGASCAFIPSRPLGKFSEDLLHELRSILSKFDRRYVLIHAQAPLIAPHEYRQIDSEGDPHPALCFIRGAEKFLEWAEYLVAELDVDAIGISTNGLFSGAARCLEEPTFITTCFCPKCITMLISDPLSLSDYVENIYEFINNIGKKLRFFMRVRDSECTTIEARSIPLITMIHSLKSLSRDEDVWSAIKSSLSLLLTVDTYRVHKDRAEGLAFLILRFVKTWHKISQLLEMIRRQHNVKVFIAGRSGYSMNVEDVAVTIAAQLYYYFTGSDLDEVWHELVGMVEETTGRKTIERYLFSPLLTRSTKIFSPTLNVRYDAVQELIHLIKIAYREPRENYVDFHPFMKLLRLL